MPSTRSGRKLSWIAATKRAFKDHPRSKVPYRMNKVVYAEASNLHWSGKRSPVANTLRSGRKLVIRGGRKSARRSGRKSARRSGRKSAYRSFMSRRR